MHGKKLIVILFIGAVLRVWLVFTAAGINSDAFKYALTAQRMAESGVVSGMRGDFFWPYYSVNRRLVVYPFLGSLVYRLTGDAILALRLVSAAAGIVLIWVVYAIARELFQGEEIALLSAALVAFHSEFAQASASVYREVLMALLISFAFLLLLWTLRKERRWPVPAFLTGLVLFASFLTRPDGVAAALALGLIALFVAPGIAWKKRIIVCAIMGLTFCALQVPYMLWLRKTSGYWLVNQWQIQRKLTEWDSAGRFLLRQARDENETVE